MILVPSAANTSSKARVNLASRSRMRNRGAMAPSGCSINSSRARWTTQGPFGWRVTPTRRTCRVPSSMTNSTYSVVSRTVSTVKKSVATIAEACARRNTRQVTDARRGAGRSPLPSSTVRMVAADTEPPSFVSSPWMRPAQHREDRTIPGSELGSLDLTAQHLELVAQDGDLDVLGVLAAEAAEQHAGKPTGHEVEEGQGHRRIIA